MEPKSEFENFAHKRYCSQTALLHRKVMGLRMEWMGECAPHSKEILGQKLDPTGALWVVYGKEEGTIGILGMPVTISPEVPAKFE